tara:strand:+ start:357 stop:770 length:414 start_codon:yes stop_codon:yes gene_type:complete
MPGLGLGLAAVTCEVMGGQSINAARYDGFWTLAIAGSAYGGISLSGFPAIVPFEIGVTPTIWLDGSNPPIDDLPDNTIWDLIDVGDGAGAVHYTPEAVSAIANNDPHDAGTYTAHYWYIGKGAADVTDTDFITTINA